jgi:Protein of unknown function (DUF1572)
MEATTGNAKTPEAEFIEASRIFLRDDYMPKLLYCLEQMSEEDVWWRPNEVSNSVGNLILHLCGNLSQWIVSSVGGAEFNRDRDAEFAARVPVPKAQLIASLRQTVAEVDDVLSRLTSERLLLRLKIQTYDASTLQLQNEGWQRSALLQFVTLKVSRHGL